MESKASFFSCRKNIKDLWEVDSWVSGYNAIVGRNDKKKTQLQRSREARNICQVNSNDIFWRDFFP